MLMTVCLIVRIARRFCTSGPSQPSGHTRDPEFDDAWYEGFLVGRGYRLERCGAVGKGLR